MSLSAAVVAELVRAGLGGDALIAAIERIEAADRPRSSTERSRAFRERQKADETMQRETLHVAEPVRARNPKTTTSENPRNNNPPSPPTGARPPKGSNHLDTRIPDHFPDEAAIDAVVEAGISRQVAEREAERFRDYWLAAPGAKGLKRDWLATWRTWCRRAIEGQRSSTGPPRQREPDYLDIAAEARRQLEELERTDDHRPDPLRLVHQAH